MYWRGGGHENKKYKKAYKYLILAPLGPIFTLKTET
jgi:hypothetical protein